MTIGATFGGGGSDTVMMTVSLALPPELSVALNLTALEPSLNVMCAV